MLDAVIHDEWYHVATDKDSSIRHLGGKFRRSIFSDNLQPIATRGKKARGKLLVDIGCPSKRAPLSVSYYNEISSGHIGSCCCSEEGLFPQGLYCIEYLSSNDKIDNNPSIYGRCQFRCNN